ncbi:MAG TPA: SDR family oxidoreductase [Blastocatellia bacterium]|jgi:NAD(P)-dependent dehydrogenase (short-subunit alcohol dehydrogenase family)|nr:SDR family oxidoreductase [Blastocatellia bacterium]
MLNINGRSVLITGGSRGLGRALALRLSAEGAKVALVARHQEEIDEVISEIRRHGGIAFGIVADVGEKESVYPIVGQAAALAGPIDVLINNASALGPVPLRLIPDTDCEDFELALQVNTVGPFRLIKAVVGSMVLRQTGVILNISSDAAVEAYPSWGVYGASKAALDHLTRIAAAEMADAGVRFLSVDPGEMDTRMHADAMPDADPASLQSPAAVAEKIVTMIRQSDRIANGSRLIASEWRPL